MPGYANAFDCAKKTLKYEGIRGFYKGMAFPLASMSFYNSLVFSVYQLVKLSLYNIICIEMFKKFLIFFAILTKASSICY